MSPSGGASTFGRMTNEPASGATPGLMHVAAPPARKYADTGRGWMVFAGVMLLLAAAFNTVISGVNAVVHLMAVGGLPVTSVIVIVVDGLIIYGLCVHGFGREGP
jgi:hypothetical protein